MIRPGFTTKLSLSWMLVLGVLLGNIGISRSGADEANAADKKEAKSKAKFSPEVEARFAEFLNKVAEAKRKLWIERSKREAADIGKTTNLDSDGIKKLEELGEKVAGLCREGWAAKFDQYWRRIYGRQTDEWISNMMEQVIGQADQYAQNEYIGDYVRPPEHPVWVDGLKSILSPEQLTAWQTLQTTRREKASKEIAEFLKPQMPEYREQFNRNRIAEAGEIKSQLSLSKERADQLDTLAGSIADQTGEIWRKRAEKTLLGMEQEQRRLILKNGRFYIGFDEDEMEDMAKLWKDGVAKLLSSEDNQRLESARQERKARRIQSISTLMIAELDQQIGFTASQRERLRPPIERLAPTVASFFPSDSNVYENSIAPQTVYTAAAGMKEEEIKDILDPLQFNHWKDVCTQNVKETNARRVRAVAVQRAKAPAENAEPAPSAEPEVLENIISDFFRDQTAAERKRTLLAMLVKAEDAARVGMIAPESADRLQTAARGAAEQSLVIWKSNLDENVRSYLNDANAENLKQRLASIPEYQFQRRVVTTNQATFLDEAIKTELNDEQRGAWKKETDARAAYRDKAIGGFVMAQFDRKTLLTKAQFEKLAPKIEQILSDYSEDISRMFSYYNSGGWYMQHYTLFMPFAGIPEKEIKEILTKEQWETWSASNECSNATNYWENVKRNHEQRVKEVKK